MVDGQIFSPTLPSTVLPPNGLGELRREINFVSIVGFNQAKQSEIWKFRSFISLIWARIAKSIAPQLERVSQQQ